MQSSKPHFLFSIREVNAHICSRGDDVELGIEDINAMNYSIQPWQSETRVALVLSNMILAEIESENVEL